VWRLRTFGGLALHEVETLAGPSLQRRALALLTLIASVTEAGVSRDKLLLYLWPDSDEEHARNALRQVVHTLRKSLASPELFLGTTDLRLNPAVIDSDLSAFEIALSRAEFEKAAELYRGPFLDGFHLNQALEFEYWADTKRADYASRAAAALERCARDAASRGDLESSAGWWRRLASMEPLNSRVALELMNALVAARDPVAALRHARMHEALVRAELGGQPDAAIAALVERLRTLDVPAAPVPAQPPAGLKPEYTRLLTQLQTELGSRYEVEQERMPREGTTRVFLARDLRHDRRVLVKVLHAGLASALDTGRFLREIDLTARLQHPSILPLLDSGEVKTVVWYVSPFFQGETLRERLCREGRLPLDAARDIARGVGSALDYAHQQGILHRDIRPENILLAGDQALVMNFGLARALDAAASPNLTLTGMLVGTPAYMSPEEARGEPLDSRSDLYGLGCVFHEMITGQPVHSGPTGQAILGKRGSGRKGELEHKEPALSGDLANVLTKALSPDPRDRYPTARELVQARGAHAGAPRRNHL
jgi:DNA-binding SARP family transcriptional activator